MAITLDHRIERAVGAEVDVVKPPASVSLASFAPRRSSCCVAGRRDIANATPTDKYASRLIAGLSECATLLTIGDVIVQTTRNMMAILTVITDDRQETAQNWNRAWDAALPEHR